MLSDIKAPYYKRSPSGSSKKGSSTSSGSRKKSNTFQEDDSSEESDENDNSTESEEGTSSQTRFQDSNSSFPIPPGFQYDFCGYILQQSQFGDVFAQMISWGDVNYEDFASPLLKDSEAYRSDSSLTASSSYSAKPLFSFQETNAYIHEDNDEDDVGEVGMSRHQVTATLDADREDDSEDDDEEDDDEDNLVSKGFGSQVSLTRNKSNQSFPFSGLSPVKKNPNRPNRRTKGRVTVKEEKFRKVTLSPINWFASIGNRHDLSLTTLEAAKVIMTFLNYRKQQILASSSSTKKSLTDKDSAVANSVKMSSSLVKIFQYLQAYFRALDPFQSHESILSALQLTSSSLHTNDIMTGEESTLSSFHFIPFLPQDGLLPYDIFKFHLLDLRIDLAEIPKPPHLFFVKAPSSLIQNNLLIIYELIVKYLPTLISSFSIPNPSKETGGPTPGMVTFSLPSSSSATTNAKEDLSLTIYRSLYEIWDELFRLSKIRVELSALRIALKYFHDEHLQMMKNGSLKERRSTGLSLEFIPQPLLPSRFELLKKAHNSFYSDGLLVEAREDSEDEGERNDEEDTLDLAQDKKRQKTLSNQQSKEDEMEEEEASSSDESFYNVSNIVKQPSSQPQNFPSSSIPVEKPENIPSNQIASYNSQASLYYGCAECSFGHYGGSVDAIWESHRCEKRDCLLPHLTMFAINIVNIDTATWKRKKAPPRRERNSQKEQPAGMRKHTDITSDLLSILSEKWDQTIDTAFPRWNQQRPMNLYN